MGKTQAAIPDSDLDLHVHGCWAVVDGVAVRLQETDNSNRTILCVCEAEGIEDWYAVEDIEFLWPDLGYVNTSTGALFCQRRASNGRHYRRAFGQHSFNVYRMVGSGLVVMEGRHLSGVIHQLYNPSYPSPHEGFMLLKLGLRPAIALSKDVALAVWEDDVLLHVGGRCVGSLDYCDGELVPRYDNDKCEFTDYLNDKMGVLHEVHG